MFVKIDKKREYIDIYYNFRDKPDYSIRINEIKNREDFWVNHLSEKRWFNNSIKEEFIQTLKQLKDQNYLVR